MSQENRDVVFISYATTDSSDLAIWLAVKLTGAGYNVWLDKPKLIGGRPFINDIEDTIKNRCCKFLALMSPEAVSRPNPKRERSIASKTRDSLNFDDFIVPIRANASFLSSDLDFYTTDHQWIDFTTSWADGLRSLLATLSESKVPKGVSSIDIDQLVNADSKPKNQQERLWSNTFKITTIPEKFYLYSFLSPVGRDDLSNWPAWRLRGTNNYLAFGPPKNKKLKYEELDAVFWKTEPKYNNILTLNILKSLLKKTFENFCLSKGLKFSPCGKRIFFPNELLPKNKIFFEGHAGRTWIQTLSDRKYLAAKDGRCFGYLAFTFKFVIDNSEVPVIHLNPSLHMTFSDGAPIPKARIPGRRKKFTQTWFNYEWLARVEATAFFLFGSEPEANIFTYESETFAVEGKPLSFMVDKGIDESDLKEPNLDTEDTLIFGKFEEEEADESASL